MTTMREVAAAANVSPATVSRVLNGTAVDPVKAARVRAAVERAGYRRNPIGRALRTRRTRNWSFIAADIEDSFFTSVLRGLDDIALANDHSVMVSNTNDDPEREAIHVRLAVENHVSGVVLATETTNPVILAPLLATPTPVVLIETASVDCGDLDTVLVDNRLGAKVAMVHLIEQGYERIACLAGPSGHHATNERLSGCGEALAATGRTIEQLVEHADYRPEGGYQAAMSLLGAPDRPDALLVFNSQMGRRRHPCRSFAWLEHPPRSRDGGLRRRELDIAGHASADRGETADLRAGPRRGRGAPQPGYAARGAGGGRRGGQHPRGARSRTRRPVELAARRAWPLVTGLGLSVPRAGCR